MIPTNMFSEMIRLGLDGYKEKYGMSGVYDVYVKPFVKPEEDNILEFKKPEEDNRKDKHE